jgi:heme-degrading monooxygenase HmoA
MSTVEEIETAIEKLPREEFFVLTGWLSEKFSQAWDSQIEEDFTAGRLDELARSAIEEHRAGKTSPFPGDAQ